MPRQSEKLHQTRFVPEIIHGRQGSGLIKLADPTTSEPVWIPLLHPFSRKLQQVNFFGSTKDDPIQYTKPLLASLTPTTQDTLRWAILDLQLPPLIATHVVMNRHLDKRQILQLFGQPPTPSYLTRPSIVSVIGYGGQYKTILTACLITQLNLPAISMDTFSPHDLTKYLSIAKQKHNTLETVKAIWQKREKHSTTKQTPLSILTILDKLAQLYHNDQRHPLVILDMPGVVADKQGHATRPLDVYDVLGMFSTTQAIQPIPDISTDTPQQVAQTIDYFIEIFQQQPQLNPPSLYTNFLNSN